MATDKQVTRKNGVPVKKFWRERITQKARNDHYTTTYPIYFSSQGMRVASLVDEKAPRSLDEAERTAKLLVEATDTEWTHATIYEMRAVARYGVEFNYKLHEAEQRAASGPIVFRQVSTTASTGS